MGELLSIVVFSADKLEDEVMERTSEENFPSLFPHAVTKGNSNDEFYSKYSTEHIIRDYIKQGTATHEVIRETIEGYIKNGTDLIIEGHQITPAIARSLADIHGRENIRSIFLLKENEMKMIEDFHKSDAPDDWILRKTRNTDTFSKIAQMIAGYSKHIESEAKKHELKTIRMDNDFSAKIEEAIETLTKEGSDSIATR